MRDVEREHLAAVAAADVLEDRARVEPALLTATRLRARDLRRFREHLEGTYLIRLFAEFEAGLRDFWRDGLGRPTTPPMRDLMEGVAARRLIPEAISGRADAVRDFRNSLVHVTPQEAEPLTLGDSRQRLPHYFKYHPPDW